MGVPAEDRAWSRGRAEQWRRRWDRQQSAMVPDRERRFDVMLDWLEAAVGRRPRCLDLGCGTGAVSERVLSRFPGARCVGVDYDPVLLRLGRSGLGMSGGRMTWVDADLRSPAWARGLPGGRYDAAISSTALHWLTGPELDRLYRSLARCLRPGGIFLNADQMPWPARSPRLAAVARRARRRGRRNPPSRSEMWARWWTAIGRVSALRSELELRAHRFPKDHTGTPTPDRDGHLRRLRRAGFREADEIWSEGDSHVLAAMR